MVGLYHINKKLLISPINNFCRSRRHHHRRVHSHDRTRTWATSQMLTNNETKVEIVEAVIRHFRIDRNEFCKLCEVHSEH